MRSTLNLNPFEIRYGYHAALRYGRLRRRIFSSQIAGSNWLPRKVSSRQIPISVVAMAGLSCMPEMVRCLSTFLNYAGQPEMFRVVSDGTLTNGEAKQLCDASPVVEVTKLDDMLASALPPSVINGMRAVPLMRKLALLLSLPEDRRWLFLDADIEFFVGAQQVLDDVVSWGDHPRFIEDVESAIDARLIDDEAERHPSINSGFLFLPRRLNWSRGLARLERLIGGAARLTEQTIVHLAMHDSNARPLDPTRYILSIDDQFEWRDRFATKPGVVCRHYVGTIRHKMWNRWSMK